MSKYHSSGNLFCECTKLSTDCEISVANIPNVVVAVRSVVSQLIFRIKVAVKWSVLQGSVVAGRVLLCKIYGYLNDA